MNPNESNNNILFSSRSRYLLWLMIFYVYSILLKSNTNIAPNAQYAVCDTTRIKSLLLLILFYFLEFAQSHLFKIGLLLNLLTV